MHHGERFPKHFTSFVSFSPVHCPLLALNRGRGACWWLDGDLKQAYLTLVSMLCASPSLRGLYTHTDTHTHTHPVLFLFSCEVMSDSLQPHELHAAHQVSLSLTISQSFLKLTSVKSVMPFNHLILCCSLLFLPSIFPSIRVFSSESALRIRCIPV